MVKPALSEAKLLRWLCHVESVKILVSVCDIALVLSSQTKLIEALKSIRSLYIM